MPGDDTANAVPCRVHGASYAVARGGRASGAGGSPLLAHFKVSGSSSSNMVDWGLVLHQSGLALKLFIEGEDGSLLLAVHVTSAASATAEVGFAGGCWDGDARGWASGVGTCRNSLWADANNIAGTSTSRQVVVACWDRWVRLGDGVVAGHFGGVCLVCLEGGGEDVFGVEGL